MNKKIMKFDLSPEDIRVKTILNTKDFLEVEFKAISTANPNRNGSHFTLESLARAIPTVYNKPILGSFSINQDDFRGHESEIEYDEELDNFYYDYSDGISEYPLGTIRESDTVEVYHDKSDDLDWLKFSAIIWVKYNYKQVKKLLKAKDGKKKISVEIEVTDYEFDDETGVEIIKDFIFDGITILGDKYETGIADATASIVDRMSGEVFQRRQKVLAFAYDGLDNSNLNTQDFEKGGEDSLKDNNLNVQTETTVIEEDNIQNIEEQDSMEKVEMTIEEDPIEDEPTVESAEPKEESDTNSKESEEQVVVEPEEVEGEVVIDSEEPEEEVAVEAKETEEVEAPQDTAVEFEEHSEEPQEGSKEPKEEFEESEEESEEVKEGPISVDIYSELIQIGEEQISVASLVEKYQSLLEKFSALEAEIRAKNVADLCKEGKEFILADDLVDDETKENFISKLSKKCNDFELVDSESVLDYAKGLLATYYYEYTKNQKKASKEEFQVDIIKTSFVGSKEEASPLKIATDNLNNL